MREPFMIFRADNSVATKAAPSRFRCTVGATSVAIASPQTHRLKVINIKGIAHRVRSYSLGVTVDVVAEMLASWSALRISHGGHAVDIAARCALRAGRVPPLSHGLATPVSIRLRLLVYPIQAGRIPPQTVR